jgi:hypothetical protein
MSKRLLPPIGSRWSRPLGTDARFDGRSRRRASGPERRQLLETVAQKAGDEAIAVSVVTVLELAHGISRADTAERRERRRRFLDELLTGVPVQPVTGPDRPSRGTDRRREPSAEYPNSVLRPADRSEWPGTGLQSRNSQCPAISTGPGPARDPALIETGFSSFAVTGGAETGSGSTAGPTCPAWEGSRAESIATLYNKSHGTQDCPGIRLFGLLRAGC